MAVQSQPFATAFCNFFLEIESNANFIGWTTVTHEQQHITTHVFHTYTSHFHVSKMQCKNQLFSHMKNINMPYHIYISTDSPWKMEFFWLVHHMLKLNPHRTKRQKRFCFPFDFGIFCDVCCVCCVEEYKTWNYTVSCSFARAIHHIFICVTYVRWLLQRPYFVWLYLPIETHE